MPDLWADIPQWIRSHSWYRSAFFVFPRSFQRHRSLPGLFKQERYRQSRGFASSAFSPFRSRRRPRETLRSLPSHFREDAPPPRPMRKFSTPTSIAARGIQNNRKAFLGPQTRFENTEVRTLVAQGAKEKPDQPHDPGRRLHARGKRKILRRRGTDQERAFVGQTFASYLPLFNVYAVFVPSRQSGITTAQPRRTRPSGSTRSAGSKRAIMPGQ